MNKQELISMYERINNFSEHVSTEKVIKNIQQLDDQPKPVLPETVAEWLSKLRDGLFGLNYDSVSSEIYDWVHAEEDNLRNLHLAFVYGYEVEKEKRYTVKVKATKQYLCNDETGPHFSPSFRSNFTKTNLEELGFGWVFDCDGIEVEEVE